MSKKSGIAWLFIIFISAFTYLSYKVYDKLVYREKVNKNIIELKEYNYLEINGNLQKTGFSIFPTVIFFFNSECQHCQAEAKLVAQNQEKFNNAEVYFFSTEDFGAIKEFAEEYGLESFRVGQVDYKSVAYPMGVNTFPMCFIYSKEGRLLKQFKGEVKIGALLHYIE